MDAGLVAPQRGADDLTAELARRIVERAVVGLESSLSVARASARIIASSEPRWLDVTHPLAARAIADAELAESHAGAAVSEQGVALPLAHNDAILGAVVVHDEPERARNPARLIKALAELVIHQATVIERLPPVERLQDRFIADLLHGRVSGEAALRAPGAFAADLIAPRVAVAFDAQAAVRAAGPPERARARLLDCLTRSSGTVADDIIAIVDDDWLALLATVDPERLETSRERLAERAQRCLDDLRRACGVALSAGIGRWRVGVDGLPQSYAEARFGAEQGRRLFGGGRVYTLRQLGLVSFLGGVGATTKHDLALQLIRPLESEPPLLATLAAFLRGNLSPSQAAAALRIHRHTLSYRLDKIERLTGLDPRRLDGAAQLYAALLLLQAAGVIDTTL